MKIENWLSHLLKTGSDSKVNFLCFFAMVWSKKLSWIVFEYFRIFDIENFPQLNIEQISLIEAKKIVRQIEIVF
jgi:hypothetical protein